MPATVTVTGKIGPGTTVTSKVISNVVRFSIDCVNNVLEVVVNNYTIQHYDIDAATTITATKSGSTYTLVVS